MSDLLKISELIAEAREHTEQPGSPNINDGQGYCGRCSRNWPCITSQLADAFEEAICVFAQGEPNDDREALALWRVVYTDDSRDCDGFYPLGPYYVLASHEDDAWNTADEIPKQDWPDTTGVYEARHATADEAAEWMASRAVVPDATPTLCAECNETEVLGKQEHRVVCMDCAYEMGRCATVPDAATELLNAHRCHDSAERAYERTIRAEAERDAALAAIERVRAWVAENSVFLPRPMAWEVERALDGAPEPEWEYGVSAHYPVTPERQWTARAEQSRETKPHNDPGVGGWWEAKHEVAAALGLSARQEGEG